MSTEKPKGLYNKLLHIQKKVIGLGKDSKGFNYTFVSGSKVLDSVKPLMNDLSLILKQEVVSIENTRQDYKTNKGEKSEILSKVMMKFTWIDCETGEKDENSFGANGQNDWDKGCGSAITYAERYFLLKFFHIATDEDDLDTMKPDTDKNEEKKEAPKKEEGKQEVEMMTEEQKQLIIKHASLVNIFDADKRKSLLEWIAKPQTKANAQLVIEKNEKLIIETPKTTAA